MIEAREFGVTHDGRKITSYLLRNARGMELEALDYGGKIRRLSVPDAKGTFENVAMSLDFTKPGFGGSLIGRYANRVASGRFTVDGTAYQAPTNIAPNGVPCLLHGGAAGFHDKIWNAAVETDARGEALVLTLRSPDGEGGFPGNLDVRVAYRLTDDNAWRIEWRATTDKKTPINFTHHVYFNLSGEARRPVSDNRVTIDAAAYTPVGEDQITTGELAPVEGTPYDFRTAHVIGERLGGLYDLNWVVSDDSRMTRAAVAEDPFSGRRLEVWSTERALQFYSGGALNDGLKDQFGRALFPFAAYAFETQASPDSLNKPDWPSTLLDAGATFESVTEYRFGRAC